MKCWVCLTKEYLKCYNLNVVDTEFMKNSSLDKFWICIHCFNYIFPFATINDYKLYQTNSFISSIRVHNVLQGISPLKYWPHTFLPSSPTKNSKSFRPSPLFISNPPSPIKILENLTPPLKCTLIQKSKDSFFK